jgi:hypothetical protein
MGKDTEKKGNPLLGAEKIPPLKGTGDGKTVGSTIVSPPVAKKEPMIDQNKVGKPLIETIVMPQAKNQEAKINNSSASLLADQRKMREKLEQDEKFPIMIPLEPGEKQGTMKDLWLNGFHVQVPKGILVRVPQGVFEVLAKSLKLNSEAGANFLISRDSKVEDALN